MKQGIVVLILLWLAWHLAVPVDFIRSDLGRHIKNGELVLQGNGDVLYKNYYSYTNPEYPFINHHWLFGVFCYALWHYLGFTGLSCVYLVLELFTFYLFFRFCQRYSSFTATCAFALLSFPLVTFRSEVRPEGISYLFCGLFLCLIDSFQQRKIKSHYLIIALCALQVIWVNTHIFFIMGPVLTALFWWQARANGEKEQADVFQKLFCLLLGMCLINPSGINGLLMPFRTDKAYVYQILENQSVMDLLNAQVTPFRSLLLYFLATLAALGMALFFLIQREGFKKYIFIGSLTVILSLAAMKAIRMIGPYGFFWMPLAVFVYGNLSRGWSAKLRKNIEIALVILGILVSSSVNYHWKQRPHLGIVSGSNDAFEFFKREKITGPIFNNYDIGGYLIFHLSPQDKLFVDDRMEAFPKDFFMKTYLPTQLSNDVWQKMDSRYHFNVIFCSLDYTPWGAAFIKNRFDDPSWAVVYFSDKAIIFLRRDTRNEGIIRRHEIKVYMV